MEDRYRIIISISHNRISFEYFLKGGGDMLVPITNTQWPAPLAFYCTINGIEIGEGALKAARSGTANAFADYFGLLESPDLFYEYGGEKKPIGKLLLDASELVFREFYSKVLLHNRGNLDDNRRIMPLTIVCEEDIKSNERVYIKDIFKDSGYGCVSVVNYDIYIDKYIKEYLNKDYTCDKVLVLWSEGDDLSMTLFDAIGTNPPVNNTIPGMGVDPRLKQVMNKIWRDVSGMNPYLDREQEEEKIRNTAIDFINSTIALQQSQILLSDGNKYNYTLQRINFGNTQSKEGVKLKATIENFIATNGGVAKNKILVLLRGSLAGNLFFESNVGSGYACVIRTDSDLRKRTMSLIVHTPIGDINEDLPVKSVFPSVVKGGEINKNKIKPEDLPQIPKDDLGQHIKQLPVVSGRDKRDFKELQKLFETRMSNSQYTEAALEIDSFTQRMHLKGVHSFDDSLNEMAIRLKTIKTPPPLPQESEDVKELIEPSPRDKRDLKIVKAEAKSASCNGSHANAIKMLADFKSRMHSKGLVMFDSEINELIKEYKELDLSGRRESVAKQSSLSATKGSLSSNRAKTEVKTDSTGIRPKSIPASPRDERDMRILVKQVESKLKNKDSAGARKAVKNFEEAMHKKGVNSFDNDIKSLYDHIRNSK